MALSQAFFAIGESRPNPAVGAVVVKDGIVVGKGRTQRPGSAHAEVMALRDAGELARGAAIYVTLEPCCHYGRTPPCTKAIIDAGIKQVYFAHSDPNPVVRGNSRRILEEAGIEVFEGADACIKAQVPESWDDCGGECRCLCANEQSALHGNHASGGKVASDSSSQVNPDSSSRVIPDLIGDPAFAHDDFFAGVQNSIQRNAADEAEGRYVFNDIERYFETYDYFVRNKRTFVEVKCAVSQEGFMGMVRADGSHAPLKITGEGANCWNHELRAMSDAVLVGAGTLLADNPSLDVRYAQGNSPVKAVWAGHHEFTAEEIERLKVFEVRGTRLEVCSDGESLCHSRLDATSHSRLDRESCKSSFNVLVFSCVHQPALKTSQNVDVVLLTGSTFPENWRQMLENLSARGMHRLMVEPGAGLAKQLFATDASSADASSAKASNRYPLWNRLDMWQSTDSSVERSLENQIASGAVSCGLDFPGLPENIVAKESAMVGPDVLTVYYPNAL
ncbi:MAG: dihydrofolate reductase family protein [Fibrobacter sp.]|nr:dihydrofolate reductase family protein [Fibrobacter sp.]